MGVYYIHEKLQKTISDMITGEMLPYYAEFNLFVNFIKDNTIKTCGVNITSNGMNHYWNENFINLLNQKQVNYVFLHETFHFLFDHIERSTGYKKEISNISQDMIINKIILNDIIKTTNKLLKGFAEDPKINGEIISIYPPIEYKGNLIFEELYWWLMKEYEKFNKNKNDVSEYLSNIFQKMENNNGEFLDKHINDKVDKEYRKQLINVVNEKLKNRGYLSNDIISTLNKLKKSNKDYLREIKKSIISTLIGTDKYSTILKPNRKNIDGIKGFKKITKNINCILDTSFSMKNNFNYVLSFIFQNNIKINLIQIDTKVKNFTIIKNKNQLNKLKIGGGGGTTLTPSLKFISNNKKLNKLNNLILTDGITDKLNFDKIKGKTLILTTSRYPIVFNNKKNVKIIKIK